jgi:hypothetical protein
VLAPTAVGVLGHLEVGRGRCLQASTRDWNQVLASASAALGSGGKSSPGIPRSVNRRASNSRDGRGSHNSNSPTPHSRPARGSLEVDQLDWPLKADLEFPARGEERLHLRTNGEERREIDVGSRGCHGRCFRAEHPERIQRSKPTERGLDIGKPCPPRSTWSTAI